MTISTLHNGYLGNKFLRNKTSEMIIKAISSLTVATKVLHLQRIKKDSDKVKLVISSFWLNNFNFFEHDKIVETSLGANLGFEVRHANHDDKDIKKVYGRTYPQRNSSEREPQMDIRNQTKLKISLGDAISARIVFKKDLLTILPIFAAEKQASSDALDITLPKDDGLYYGVISAVQIIKEYLFSEITITSDNEFTQSREYTLLVIQLRRIGYSISFENNLITGRLGNKIINKRHSIDTSRSTTKNKPVRFDKSNPLSTTGVCTSGVDIASAEDDGFSTLNVLDYRPIEARDLLSNIDKSETGAVCAAYNTKSMKTVFNECIYGMDTVLMRDLMRPTNFLSLSLQCSEYTTVKNVKDKEDAIESLATTIDMFFPVLDIIEKNNYCSLLTENVRNFASSVECELYIRRLDELGYQTYKASSLNAEHFNGYTMRNRCYIFATKLPTPFQWPEKELRTANVWNDIVIPNLSEFRNVTHTGGIQTMLEGQKIVASGEDVSLMSKSKQTVVRKFNSRNIVDESSHVAGTIIRSQSKQVAESIYIKHGDQYLIPNNSVLKAMMGIRESFDLSIFTNEAASELIGQSIEVPMHRKISLAIKKHIMGHLVNLKDKTKSSPIQVQQLSYS
ncbi:MAG: site-specific DNA-cytosine methylase [Colwellia sp.]|jgi:site-specific DNA-cytosine methylase